MNKEDNNEELFIPKTKYKGLKIFLAIILIAGLIVGGYFLYQYKFNNPKTIINNALNDTKEEMKKSLITDISNNKYKVNGYFKVDANLGEEATNITDILNNLEIAFSGEVDPSNAIGNIEINTKYKNDKLIDMNAYYEKNMFYILLNDLYDKYLKVNISEEQENEITKILPENNINQKDIQELLNELIDSAKEEINKLDIKKIDETITIDDKDVNVFNYYIELHDKEVNNFIKNIINSLKNNNHFTSTLKKITDSDIEDIFKNLISGIDSESFKGIYRINFYTYKNIFNKKIISIRQTIEQQGMIMDFTIDKIDENDWEVSISTIGMEYSIRVKKTDSILNISFKETIMDMYLKAELNMNYEKINEITKPNISNSKDIKDLTEKEKKQIEENLRNNQYLENIYKKITKSEEINEV